MSILKQCGEPGPALDGGISFSEMSLSAVQMVKLIREWDRACVSSFGHRGVLGLVMPHADRLAMQCTYFGVGGEGGSVWSRVAQFEFRWSGTITCDDRMLTAGPGGLPRWMFVSDDTVPSLFFVNFRPTKMPSSHLAPAALRFINSSRSRTAQRELDPAASGWTDDDIVIEARRLGWDAG